MKERKINMGRLEEPKSILVPCLILGPILGLLVGSLIVTATVLSRATPDGKYSEHYVCYELGENKCELVNYTEVCDQECLYGKMEAEPFAERLQDELFNFGNLFGGIFFGLIVGYLTAITVDEKKQSAYLYKLQRLEEQE
jgi:hypothetical protein